MNNYFKSPMFNMQNMYEPYQYPYWIYPIMYNPSPFSQFEDYGPEPFVVNIEDATIKNNTFRTALWTGENLQVTLMSIAVGDDIGLEVHPNGDQFIRIEAGQGIVLMGDERDRLDYQKRLSDDIAIMIPAGKWHNIINTGNTPLKVYAIYAPPEHQHGTVHNTKADALDAE
jgi:mannose-6-phosphate isomerase-like protein (cupin superfamily)